MPKHEPKGQQHNKMYGMTLEFSTQYKELQSTKECFERYMLPWGKEHQWAIQYQIGSSENIHKWILIFTLISKEIKYL